MRKIAMWCLFFLLTTVCWAGETWQFTILHTNDLHGWMLPFDYQTTNAQFMKTNLSMLVMRRRMPGD